MSVEVLYSLAEALFPGIRADRAESQKDPFAQFLALKGSNFVSLPSLVMKTIRQRLPINHQRDTCLLLGLLEWRLGTLLLAGTQAITPAFPYIQPFAQLPVGQREAMLQKWATSSFAILRKAFRGLKALVAYNLFSQADELGTPELWQAMDYGGLDPPLPPRRAPSQREQLLINSIIHLPDIQGSAGLHRSLEQQGLQAALCSDQAEGRDAQELHIQCDAVIVGSGAGGGVAAAVLAAAGLKVIVVEKGDYTPTHKLTWKEKDAFGSMYERGGLMFTHTGGMAVLAGATVGGGTRINWNASFRTPDHVRKEWAEQHGLAAFASAQYDAALDAVCARLGVKAGAGRHNLAGAALQVGLEALGAHSQAMPRNCARDDCGWCNLGCAHGAKQDVAATYLSDAVAHGAVVLSGAFAEKVLTAGSPGQERRRATGIRVSYLDAGQGPGQLRISARVVVAAAGALHTPALLLRSGIRAGGVGANLRLHPATCVIGILPPEEPGQQERAGLYNGPIMSVYSREVADWHGKGYGALLSTPSGHPGLVAAVCPWVDGHSYKLRLAAAGRAAPVLVYVRDRDAGHVKIDAQGQPELHYWPSALDSQSLLKGMELAARVLKAAGSQAMYMWQEVPTCGWTANAAAMPGETDFALFLENMLKTGIKENTTTITSAHQMGTARLGTSPNNSVLNPRGECWEVANLFVTDASALPTSTGTNPMVTIEATAYMLSKGIAAALSANGNHLVMAYD